MAFYWTANQKPLNPHRSSGWANVFGLILFLAMAWTFVYCLVLA